MLKARTIGIVGSLSLTIIGVLTLMRIPYFYARSQIQGQRLIQEAQHQVTVKKTSYQPVSNITVPKNGSLIGTIKIPSLELEAPVVQGTTENVLNHGAGHLATSVMPGEIGTSVIAAHNATWFRHIDDLKVGNTIEVETRYGKFTFDVTRAQIVHVGTPVYNSSEPNLVLESCYPLNALYLTPYRYLVYAKMDSSTKGVATQSTVVYTTYRAFIPSHLIQEGLTLSTNSMPMGTMSYTGSPSRTYTESGSPLSASGAIVQLYLAWLHATSEQDVRDLKTLGFSATNSPFMGAPLSKIHYYAPFDETLDVKGDSLQTISAVAYPSMIGGAHFQVIIKGKVNGHTISIKSLDVRKVSD